MTPATPRFLVTAGNTREMIDRVRDWGNIFTGNTGFAIANELVGFGQVDLLTSNRQHIEQLTGDSTRAHPIVARRFTSHADLKDLLSRLLAEQTYHAIFMTAAVADYRPTGVYAVLNQIKNADGTETWTMRDVQAGKVKSSHPAIAVLGTPTDKIVDLFRKEWNHRGLLFKFKLEVGLAADELVRIGQASRKASGADYLVANTLEMVEGANAGAYLLSDDGAEFIPRNDLAPRLAQVVRDRSESE